MQFTAVRVLGDSGKEYTIDVKDGSASCSCMAFVFHPETPCKHMVFAANALAPVRV